MNNNIFELNNVHLSYLGRHPALCGVDMTIGSGEKIAIIGANGTGKSTLLHLLDGLVFPHQGQVKAFGQVLNEEFLRDEENSRAFRRKVGLVLQNADIQLFCPTVREDIAFGPLHLGFEQDEVQQRLKRASASLGVEHLLDRVPYQLSVGEKRKVAIASVLAIEPEVIILDEPTAGLDPATIRQVIDLILEANQRGKTIIMATHDLHLVEAVADKVYVFSQEKKIVRSGAMEEILYDMTFLQEHNLIHAHNHQHHHQVHSHPHQHFGHRHE
ncbi:MAG: ABC transporter ATP-binding protein [Candidatus Omnitrophica bacterium]|nr:ABC transporter ATP-binding protein [Candidatus Omnitrophota bacterium]